MHTDKLRYWIALTFIDDVGPVTARKLLSIFGTPDGIFHAGTDALMDAGIRPALARTIAGFAQWDAAEKELHKAGKQGVSIIPFNDPGYPEQLRQIGDAPVLLYAKGSLRPADRYAVAVVGSRRMTEYGRRVTEKFCRDFSRLGITVVSGMARGIDTVAHRSTIEARGRTIAVLGSGIDHVYPRENAPLVDSITENGCVISEFPFGTEPQKEHFPRRNRVISGLSLGVMIVEAAPGSGSLITARYANEQGREVFAIPGNITSPLSEGTNALIQNGAKLVRTINDIIEEIAVGLKGLITETADQPGMSGSRTVEELAIPGEEKAICTVLRGETKHIDVIARETGVHPSRLLGILLSLEMKGFVVQAGGMRFSLR